jgi:hypothetical protein
MPTLSGTWSGWDGMGYGYVYDTTWTVFAMVNWDGTWSASDIPDGTYDLIFDTGSYGTCTPDHIDGVVVAGEDVTGLDCTWSPPTWKISGYVRVRTFPTGIEGAKVVLSPVLGGDDRIEYTNVIGYYEFDGLPDYTSWIIDIEEQGWVYTNRTVYGPGPYQIDVFGGDWPNQNFTGVSDHSGEGWLVLDSSSGAHTGLYEWDEADERYEHYDAGSGKTFILEGGENPLLWQLDAGKMYFWYMGSPGDLPSNPWVAGPYGVSSAIQVWQSWSGLPPHVIRSVDGGLCEIFYGATGEAEEAGGEGREVTTTRAISLSAASALAGTRTANLSASTESTETRAAQLWSQETLEALRTAESFVAEALAGTRPGEAGGEGLLTALRTLAAFVEETLTGTRSAEALALDDIQQARSLEAWAEEILAKTQSLELIGAEEAAGLRQAEVPAEQSLAETREGASWGAERQELTLSLEALASEVLAGTRHAEGWAEEPIDGSRTAEALGEVGAATERVLRAFAQHVLGCEQAGTVWGAVLAGETWAAETWAEAIEAAARTAELYSGDTQVGARAARAFAISLLSSARTLALFGEEALEGSRTGEGWAEEPIDGSRTAEALGEVGAATERVLRAFAQHVLGCEQAGTVWGAVLAGETWAAETWAEAIEAAARTAELYSGDTQVGARAARAFAISLLSSARTLALFGEEALEGSRTGESLGAGLLTAERVAELWAEALEELATLRSLEMWAGAHLIGTREAQGWAQVEEALSRGVLCVASARLAVTGTGEMWAAGEEVASRALYLSAEDSVAALREIALTGSSLPATQRAAFLQSLVGQQILYEGEAWGFEEQVGTRALLLSGAHPASGTRQCFFWAGGAVRGRRMNPHVMPGMHPGLFGGGG